VGGIVLACPVVDVGTAICADVVCNVRQPSPSEFIHLRVTLVGADSEDKDKVGLERLSAC